MRRYSTIGVLVTVALLAHAATASAQRWGREGTPRAGVCFYEDINFEGRYFCTAPGATAEVPSGTNDEISSVRVFGNSEVTIFRDPGFRGKSRVINNSVADLRGMGFNDRISSYQVEARGFGNGNGNGGGWNDDRGNSNNRPRWSYREAETMVARTYRQVLRRDADEAGLRSWTQQVMRNNWTQGELERAFRQSDEFRSLQNDRGRR
jgi:hypothetical protein